jgi:hypothetical protein
MQSYPAGVTLGRLCLATERAWDRLLNEPAAAALARDLERHRLDGCLPAASRIENKIGFLRRRQNRRDPPRNSLDGPTFIGGYDIWAIQAEESPILLRHGYVDMPEAASHIAPMPGSTVRGRRCAGGLLANAAVGDRGLVRLKAGAT